MQGFQDLLRTNSPLPSVLVKFMKYGLTGGVAAIIDIGGFVLFLATGLTALSAATFSFLLALVTNYILTSHFIYATRPNWQGGLHFAVFAALGLCLNVSITLITLNYLGFPPFFAKTTGVGIAFITNFLMVHFIVFREEK